VQLQKVKHPLPEVPETHEAPFWQPDPHKSLQGAGVGTGVGEGVGEGVGAGVGEGVGEGGGEGVGEGVG